MNALLLNTNDREQTLLWQLVSKAKNHHEFITRNRVTAVNQLTRHKKQVEEIFDELRHVLENYPKWSSGRNLVSTLIDFTLDIEEYNRSVFARLPNQAAGIVTRFNNRRDDFIAIAQGILDHYKD
mgnify:CR=1 FL=1